MVQLDRERLDGWTRNRAAGALSQALPDWAQLGGVGSCTNAITLTPTITGTSVVETWIVLDANHGAIDTGPLILTGLAIA